MKTDIELKARAKRLRVAINDMIGKSVTSSQSLELVAKEENYPNWDAASASYGNTGIKQSTQGGCANVSPMSILGYEKMYGMYVIAMPGAGKHLQATAALINNLTDGKTVYVFDRGFSYKKITEVLGGTFILLQPDGTYQVDRHSDASLFVFEFNELGYDEFGFKAWPGQLPFLENVLWANSFIVIDETHAISKAYPEIKKKFQQWVKQKASFCITGQTDECIAPFLDVPGPTITMRLSRK
jgi:hypothetical protein